MEARPQAAEVFEPTAASELIQRWTRRPLAKSVVRHLHTVHGIENIPESGPVVIVANHRSYYDHLVMRSVLSSRRSGRCWFLTKQEAFEGRMSRAFHVAWDAIPVDRDKPSLSAFRLMAKVLADGDALVIYPEGTRNPTDELLPFKPGAFMAALMNDAPIVPIGMVGSDAVLPKGAIRPRRSRISVNVGDVLPRPAPGREKARMEELADVARQRVSELVVEGAELNASAGGATPPFDIAGVVDRRLEVTLDEGGHLSRGDAFLLEFLAQCSRFWFKSDIEIAVQRARILGLRAEHLRLLRKIGTAFRVHHLCRIVLRVNPDHMLANYVLGRWHLTVPAALGARRARALSYLNEAAEHSGEGETRAWMALAETSLADGQTAEASRILHRIIDETDPASSRHSIRLKRCHDMLDQISRTGPQKVLD